MDDQLKPIDMLYMLEVKVPGFLKKFNCPVATGSREFSDYDRGVYIHRADSDYDIIVSVYNNDFDPIIDGMGDLIKLPPLKSQYNNGVYVRPINMCNSYGKDIIINIIPLPPGVHRAWVHATKMMKIYVSTLPEEVVDVLRKRESVRHVIFNDLVSHYRLTSSLLD